MDENTTSASSIYLFDMTSSNTKELNTQTALANNLDALLTAKTEHLTARIRELESEIKRINSLKLMSHDEERTRTLDGSLKAVNKAERLLTEARKEGSFFGLMTPLKTIRCWVDLNRVRTAYTTAESNFDAIDTKAERSTRIAHHNQQVNSERRRLAILDQQRISFKDKLSTIDQLHTQASDAIRAAHASGWMAADFPQKFRRLVELVENDDIDNATSCLATLVFQRRPTDALYEQWCREARGVRDKAYQQYAGVAASGAYTEITEHSIELATPSLQGHVATTLEKYGHPADKWQALSSFLTDPRKFRTDALWAIYWAMHQCGQWVANATSESDTHEDILTGKVMAQIDRWLAGWAAERIKQFGYPETSSYFGTLEIASTREETRLGADIGLIVDLHIGDLACQKIALFQAKKAKRGYANIGSNSGQLSKLVQRPKAGFYLFYHDSTYPVMAPAPSVCAAHELAEEINRLGKDVNEKNLHMNVRAMGWDWASFISFGLSDPSSRIGESFSTIDEALTALGGGDTHHLPKYLHIIAIANEPRVMELRMKVHEFYRERTEAMTKDNSRKKHHSRDRDEPEHGMSR